MPDIDHHVKPVEFAKTETGFEETEDSKLMLLSTDNFLMERIKLFLEMQNRMIEI